MSEPARILIVDDDWLVGRAIQQILETAGHHVVACVASDREALKVAVDLSLNLAVVDIRLPGDLDGVELARIFAIDRPFRSSSSQATVTPERLRGLAT